LSFWKRLSGRRSTARFWFALKQATFRIETMREGSTNLENDIRRKVVPGLLLAAIAWACNSGTQGIEPPPGNSMGGTAGATPGTAGATPGKADSGSTPPTAPSDWCSARKVLEDNCVSCHFAGTPWATIPLVTYEELQARLPSGLLAYASVGQRIHDPARLMPPTADRLTATELATLDNWIAAGASAGPNPSCMPGGPGDGGGSGGAGGSGGSGGAGAGGTAGHGGGGAGGADGGVDADVKVDGGDAPDGGDAGRPDGRTDADGGLPPPTGWPTDCEQRFTVLAHGRSQPGDTTKFNVTGAGLRDFHQCFLFKAPWAASTVQALRFRPVIDDARVVARWALYGLDSSSGSDGQVGATGCGNGTYLQGWAPGATETVLPPDVGLQMPRGANAFLALEIHYDNTANHRDAMDASGVEWCVTRTLRARTASVHRLGSTNISLPPRSQNAVVNTCDPTATQPVRLIAIQPQMNRLGIRSQLLLNRAGGMRETLHEGPFGLTDQRTYPSMATVNDGDTLTTTCTYDNTTSTSVGFGNAMTDETCYVFVTAWPAGALSGFFTPNRCIGLF
jgi:hypothetical protein